jgi:metallo-beta-lactamase family protein
MKIKFLGAAREVTGSKSLLSHKNHKYLIDCGLFQVDKDLRLLNWSDLREAHLIDAVILTHAHIDHSGYLPRLIQQGFEGPIFCTDATAALVKILLRDAAHLEEEDAEYANRSKYSSHRPALPLFTVEDVERVLKKIKIVPRDEWHQLDKDVSFQFIRSGHILGSSIVQVSYHSESGPKLVTFTGDLGSERSNIIKGPAFIHESDVLVLESTYGDRVHKAEGLENKLADIINEVIARQGVLLIPSFAVGRTQELLFLVSKLLNDKKIPKVPVVVDSPMGIEATKAYGYFTDELKLVEEGRSIVTSMESLNFRITASVEDSIRLNRQDGPLIVISSAGMLTGGRILHHLKQRLPDTKNAVLFVGHQAEGTKGRLLLNGIDRLWIHREEIKVNASIHSLDGLSAHADSNELIDWVKHFKVMPSMVFLNHGELSSMKALAYRLKRELGIEALIPSQDQEYELI